MERSEEQRYAGLSPFEVKNRLVELATHRGERMMLNAGRGNPNWIALEPRAAFFLLGEFAVAEARRVAHTLAAGTEVTEKFYLFIHAGDAQIAGQRQFIAAAGTGAVDRRRQGAQGRRATHAVEKDAAAQRVTGLGCVRARIRGVAGGRPQTVTS